MTFDFREMMSGEQFETGTQTAYRFWRYSLDAPVHLGSWVSTMKWFPGQPVKATTPDKGDQGIHGYRTLEGLMFYLHNNGPEQLATSVWHMRGYDGIVIGTVAMWGIIWDHSKGFRAEFAKPSSFISAHAIDKKSGDKDLSILRKRFRV